MNVACPVYHFISASLCGEPSNHEMSLTVYDLRQTAFGVAHRMLGDAADAENIAQNCLVKLLSLDWQGIKSPLAYVATMAARDIEYPSKTTG
ncbi:MAG: hypothetical protein JKX91_11400 [Rhizobiaceae bacterium]|nr:hypothetical protein [Rhizobiaceae bacterium]